MTNIIRNRITGTLKALTSSATTAMLTQELVHINKKALYTAEFTKSSPVPIYINTHAH
jgi:hypothetical protein